MASVKRMAAAVQVVELALGDRVVDVDRREHQLAALVHLVQAHHTGRRLFGDTFDLRQHARPLLRIGLQRALQQAEHDREFRVRRRRGIGNLTGLFELGTFVHQHRCVAAIVEDHVGSLWAGGSVGPRHHLLGTPPVLLQRLALPCEHRHTVGLFDRALRTDCDSSRGVILRGEDVAARPAHFGAELDERLDQHSGLDGHVQRAGDACTGKRLRRAELLAQGAQAGHLVLGKVDLFAPERGERQIGDAVIASRRE